MHGAAVGAGGGQGGGGGSGEAADVAEGVLWVWCGGVVVVLVCGRVSEREGKRRLPTTIGRRRGHIRNKTCMYIYVQAAYARPGRGCARGRSGGPPGRSRAGRAAPRPVGVGVLFVCWCVCFRVVVVVLWFCCLVCVCVYELSNQPPSLAFNPLTSILPPSPQFNPLPPLSILNPSPGSPRMPSCGPPPPAPGPTPAPARSAPTL